MLAHDKEVFLKLLFNKVVTMVWLVRALTPGPQKHSECLLIREIVEGISALRRLNSVAFKLFGLMFL